MNLADRFLMLMAPAAVRRDFLLIGESQSGKTTLKGALSGNWRPAQTRTLTRISEEYFRTAVTTSFLHLFQMPIVIRSVVDISGRDELWTESGRTSRRRGSASCTCSRPRISWMRGGGGRRTPRMSTARAGCASSRMPAGTMTGSSPVAR